MKSLYISRVIIKNYRNFENIDVRLSHKQVIIGENNVGKTNFLRAIQLILDQGFSDDDRTLEESDFYDGLEKPMENMKEIEISIYISGYKHNKTILAVLSDATVMDNGEEALLITYKYYPTARENGKVEYQYNIYKAGDPVKLFNHEDRKYINIKVIKAIRDVEGEMKNARTSPINKLLDKYSIDTEDLKDIAEKLKTSGADVLTLDEIVDLENNINTRFTGILGVSNKFDVSLKTIDIDPNRILKSLNILLSERPTYSASLGLNNILYISLMLLMLQDKTIPSFMKKAKYDDLKSKVGGNILEGIYEASSKGNYFIKEEIEEESKKKLYEFMDKHDPKCDGVTILAIEEPEAHLHPSYQRLIYKDVIRNSNNSVLLTTHSTHITAVASLESIVHLHKKKKEATRIMTTASLKLDPSEKMDLERYLDVKRGEIYLGNGVILVEGIAEEYLVPRFAEIVGKPLDEKGIIVCNVNSTNFKPYVKLLKELKIPFAVITDGDFYYKDKDKDGDDIKIYHDMHNDKDPRDIGYLGHDIVCKIFTDLELMEDDILTKKPANQDEDFRKLGFFVGYYTLEVDIMDQCTEEESKDIIYNVFCSLTDGGKRQKENFKKEINNQNYWKCLAKIESNSIGKGRFAQTFSSACVKDHIPEYINDAIDYIYDEVDEK